MKRGTTGSISTLVWSDSLNAARQKTRDGKSQAFYETHNIGRTGQRDAPEPGPSFPANHSRYQEPTQRSQTLCHIPAKADGEGRPTRGRTRNGCEARSR